MASKTAACRLTPGGEAGGLAPSLRHGPPLSRVAGGLSAVAFAGTPLATSVVRMDPELSMSRIV